MSVGNLVRARQSERMTDEAKEFLLAEFEALRAEIDALRESVQTCANFAIVSSAAFWAWLVTHNGWQGRYWFITYIPAAMAVLFGLRWIALVRVAIQAGEYIRKVETTLNLPQGLGWESHLAKNRNHVLTYWHAVYYVALLLGNLAIAQWAQVVKPLIGPG